MLISKKYPKSWRPLLYSDCFDFPESKIRDGRASTLLRALSADCFKLDLVRLTVGQGLNNHNLTVKRSFRIWPLFFNNSKVLFTDFDFFYGKVIRSDISSLTAPKLKLSIYF